MSARLSFLCLLSLLCQVLLANGSTDSTRYPAGHEYIKIIGRTDRSNTAEPRFWASGVYMTIRFKGSYCVLEIKDEEKWGKSHNYLHIIVDNGKPVRIQTKSSFNRIVLASGLSDKEHEIVVCKDTEASIGFLQPATVICPQLLPARKAPKRKIEFIGNSITCGMGNYDADIKCGSGEWYDQHSAYMAYGPQTARLLNAQWQLTSESGIGLIKSCCDKKNVMPQIFDKTNIATEGMAWDFKQYQPDVVTVCLGQNDGIQDSAAFCSAYVSFVQTIRRQYPRAEIILLTSPMADKLLDSTLRRYITAVEQNLHKPGDKRISHYFFPNRYTGGCSYHPNLQEHTAMAAELSAYIRKRMNW
ncbi:MAG: SGNH/GDSL hydrolase family protein [Chitinophagaceae bacterium]